MSNQIISEGLIASIVATATGDNVCIATQGSTRSIVVNAFNIVANTATANMVASLQPSGTTTAHFTNHMITKGQRVDVVLGGKGTGWTLPKNSGLDLNMSTAGSLAVDIVYSIVDDI